MKKLYLPKDNTILFTVLAETGNYTMLNKPLVRKLGMNAAFILCEFVSSHNYCSLNNNLQSDGSFYLSKFDLEF